MNKITISNNLIKLLQKSKTIIDSPWFFSTLIIYYGIFYIFLGERYYLNDGMSMDGIVFSSFIQAPTSSYFFDTYYIHRILPSVLVGFFFKLFSVSINNTNIFTAFQILNMVSIALACYFIKKALSIMKVSLKNQLLSLTLFVVNFAVLKMPFHLAIMTDSAAMGLSAAMLYFYLKKNNIISNKYNINRT